MTFSELPALFGPAALIAFAAATIGTLARQARLADWARSLELTERQKIALADLWHAAQSGKAPSRDPLAGLTEEERNVLWFFSEVVARPAEFNYPKRAEEHAERVREQVIAKYLSLGFSEDHADLIGGMFVNKLRESITGRRSGLVRQFALLPAPAKYIGRLALASGAAAAIYPLSWCAALASIPTLMYASNIMHEEPEPASAKRATFDAIVYFSIVMWAIVATVVLVTETNQWWGFLPGIVTAFVGYHSLVPGRWVDEHQAVTASHDAA